MRPRHIELLEALNCCSTPGGEFCAPFAAIQRSLASVGSQWEIKEIRRVVRHLARKGLTEFHSPLWGEDGRPRGAGYCISKAGQTVLEATYT